LGDPHCETVGRTFSRHGGENKVRESFNFDAVCDAVVQI